MKREDVLKVINREAAYIIEGLNHLYHNKFFVVSNGSSVKFFKTSRSANTYANKQASLSWYDDYSKDMTNNTCQVFEVKLEELQDVSMDYNFWNDYVLKNMHNIANYCKGEEIMDHAKKLVNDSALLDVIASAIRQIEENGTFKSFKSEIENIKNETAELEQVDAGMASDEEVEVFYNEEKLGIELKFKDKPNSDTRELLKVQGFKWSKYNRIWYAKDTEENRSFVIAQFASNKKDDTVCELSASEWLEVDIEDVETYTVDSELSRRENAGHWITRSKDIDHQAELQEQIRTMNNELLEALGECQDDRLVYESKKWLQTYKKRYYNWYIKRLKLSAENSSWVITGRCGRNARKDNKHQKAYNQLMTEYMDKLKPEYENKLSSIKAKINRSNSIAKQSQVKKLVNNTPSIKLSKSKALINCRAREGQNIFEGGNIESTVYNYEGYSIIKSWGVWGIYKDGLLIDSNKYASLDTAKKMLALKVC